MAASNLPSQDVFLSSAFMKFMDERAKIVALDKSRIWAVEIQRPDLDTRKDVPPFVIVDTLVEQIRKSKVFICVLRDWYGSSVFENTESVSFLETEIYEAALFHNNVHFFLMEPFNPDPRLKALLDLVNAIRPSIIPAKALPEREVVDGIKRVLERTKRRGQQQWTVSLRKLVGELAFRRGHPNPDIEFFDKVFRPVYSDAGRLPDKDHIKSLLTELSGLKGKEQRLTRMWIALRELSAAPYNQPEFKEYLPLWNEALGAWTSAAAWYGLHGHLYAGRLAGTNSILKIRAVMDWSHTKHQPAHHVKGAKGGRASEYYSIAKLMPTMAQRNEYLEFALADLRDAFDSISGDVSGYLAIRGHIFQEQGELAKALSDFEEMRRHRERRGDTGGVGEALADLGLIHLKLKNTRQAVALLRQGTEMLQSAGRHDFAIRAKKRLALAYLQTFHPYRAFRELCEAYDMAQERQVYDQITPLMEMVHRLGCRLRVWGMKEPR